MPGVCSISLTAGELGPAIMKTVSRVPARRAWTASVPVVGNRRAVASVMPLAASSVRATARVPLPSGPIASRRPLSSRRSVGPGAVREKTHSGSKYRLASETRVSVFAAEAVPPCTKAISTPLLGSSSSRMFSTEPEVSRTSSVTPALASRSRYSCAYR